METVQIDWLSIFIAAILNMAVGFLWYSKWLFGPSWMKFHKITEKDLKNGGKSHLFSGFIVSLVVAFFLSLFEGYLGVVSVADGMFIGLLIWLGFVATTQLSGVIWCKYPVKMFMIDTGCKLLSFLVMSGVIAV